MMTLKQIIDDDRVQYIKRKPCPGYKYELQLKWKYQFGDGGQCDVFNTVKGMEEALERVTMLR